MLQAALRQRQVSSEGGEPLCEYLVKKVSGGELLAPCNTTARDSRSTGVTTEAYADRTFLEEHHEPEGGVFNLPNNGIE